MSKEDKGVDVSSYKSGFSLGQKAARALWHCVWLFLFRPTPVICFAWRGFLLRLFGAKLGKGVHVYPSCRVWAPWNLEMHDHTSMSHHVDCYDVGKVIIRSNATVSQYAFLCTASHDISESGMDLKVQPIEIGDGAWVCAKAYIGPGIKLAEGAIAAAGAVVTKDVEPWSVVGGNPAEFIKKREIK